MNVATKIERPHFSQVLDQTKTIEWYLEQYGSWLLVDSNYESLGFKSWLGNLIDTQNGVVVDRRERTAPRCRIDINHALAVEGLLNNIFTGENDKVKTWFKVVVMYYVEFRSEAKIAKILGITETAVIKYKLLGLVRLATKYKLRSKITE